MESPHHRERQQQTRLLEIDPVALLNDGPKETWEAISDLDAFFGRMYTYYYERGLRCILFSRVISLLTLAFTILLFFFLVEVLDWHAILHECTSEETCQTISIIRSDAFGGMSTYTMLYYYLLFTLYWLWSFVHFLIELRPLLEMHALFRDKLKIDDADLHVISWDELVVKVIELQRTARLCIVKDELTAHDIASRIMRKDNFLIALVNHGLLPHEPLLQLQPLSMCLGMSMLLSSGMSKPLEWSLYVSVLDAMFDAQFRIRKSFTRDVGALQLRLVLCGVVNLALAPFFVLFMLVFFFLKHAEEFRRRPANSALSRDYSLHARWTMREFNELPHVFEARLQASHADASAYIRQFPAPLTTLFARFITFIVSAVAAILLLLSLMNEKFLFYRWPPGAPEVGFNVLWWLALLSTVLAVSRTFDGLGQGGTETPYGLVTMQPDALLQSLALHTHHMPEHWRGRGHTRAVYSEFKTLYPYRFALLLHEVLGAVTAPLIMIFLLPPRAGAVLDFLRTFTVYVEGVGHVCSLANFDFERHGDPRYGSPHEGAPFLRSRDGKMEKAYVNFRAQHPSWRDDRGDGLLKNIGGAAGVGGAGGGAALSASMGVEGSEPSGAGGAGTAVPGFMASAMSPGATHVGAAAMHSLPHRSVAFSHNLPQQRSVAFSHTAGCGGTFSCAAGSTGMGMTALGLGIDASFSASAMEMLMRSSHLLDPSHQLALASVANVDSFTAQQMPMMAPTTAHMRGLQRNGLAGSLLPHSLAALAATHSSLGMNTAVSSETRTQQIATGLYSRLDLFYAATSPCEQSVVAGSGLRGEALRGAAPPRSAAAAGMADDDYQLHDDAADAAPPPSGDGHYDGTGYELRPVVRASAEQSRAAGAACAASILQTLGTV
ncbi:hypothetical protein Ctob_004993 [Chrysochromulina tobinii]|uniref:Autophagy-related protein 9 n=1 Tax=Chrysochromulina tobinii TaxID=1460289 RepID=A0A0M0JW68_9EUKA|nr:hypothetical protein Ctob_004993 [Chrysochromulina tobinii]|eukprot:KOO30532.1 hypothetical protein Ctob_004993 [Chrysochromulina sp. CCMP291]